MRSPLYSLLRALGLPPPPRGWPDDPVRLRARVNHVSIQVQRDQEVYTRRAEAKLEWEKYRRDLDRSLEEQAALARREARRRSQAAREQATKVLRYSTYVKPQGGR